MQQKHIPPQPKLDAFNCPHCQVYARQLWFYMHASSEPTGYGTIHNDNNFEVSVCNRCNASTIWLHDRMIFPNHGFAEPPNADLSDDIRQDYIEAGSILNNSPRGAAALLRLAIQKLCKFLGQSGKDINADIKALVALGLPLFHPEISLRRFLIGSSSGGMEARSEIVSKKQLVVINVQ